MLRTNDGELDGHEDAEEVIEHLEDGPLGGLHEAPGAGRENEGVPCGDGESADEKVLVGGEMGRKVERGREDVCERRHVGRPARCGRRR